MGYNEFLLFWDRYGIKHVCPFYIYCILSVISTFFCMFVVKLMICVK